MATAASRETCFERPWLRLCAAGFAWTSAVIAAVSIAGAISAAGSAAAGVSATGAGVTAGAV